MGCQIRSPVLIDYLLIGLNFPSYAVGSVRLNGQDAAKAANPNLTMNIVDNLDYSKGFLGTANVCLRPVDESVLPSCIID